MVDLSLIKTVVFIHFLAVITPGQNFLVIVSNSLTYSQRVGIYTVVGIIMGYFLYIFLCLTGLTLLIEKFPALFDLIKYVGSFYLIYLGAKIFLSKTLKRENLSIQTNAAGLSPLQAIKMGFFTTLSNPKSHLFWSGLFSLILTPAVSKLTLTVVICLLSVNGFIWYSLVAIFFTQKRVRDFYLNFEEFFNKIFGGFLLVIGVKFLITQIFPAKNFASPMRGF